MAPSAIFVVLALGLSAVYGYFVGRAKARRSRELWSGLKEGRPEAYAVVALVAAVVVYVLINPDV